MMPQDINAVIEQSWQGEVLPMLGKLHPSEVATMRQVFGMGFSCGSLYRINERIDRLLADGKVQREEVACAN